MMLRSKTALGIEVSDERINLVLLKRDKTGTKLLKTASGAVPAGAIENGDIKDPIALAKAIKELKAANKIRANQTAVSLLARPVVEQVMDMPAQVPSNIGQFVQDELKHCVVLQGREIASDFCGIGSGGGSGNRLLVVATDGQKVREIAKAFSQTNVSVDAIEPPLLAYARAFHAKKIAGKFDSNVLMVILHGSVLTLCVFRNQTLDFVRTKNISKEISGPEKLCHWLASQINAITRFYEIEVPDSPGKWETTVLVDGTELPKDAEESLRAKVASDTLEVRTAENAYQDTPVEESQCVETDKPSPVAIGLAMRFLATNGKNLRVNLLPPGTVEIRSAKKDALITANIVAGVLSVMILAAGGLILATKKLDKNIAHKKQTQSLQDIKSLFKEQEWLDGRIKLLSDRANQLNDIFRSRGDVDWLGLLNDIRMATPKTVQITNLFSKDSSTMSLEGLALSYEAVRLFVDMLAISEHIDSASLNETGKDNKNVGLIRYKINCALTTRKGR